MIKTFKQYCSEKYGNPIDEAFQNNSDLKEILKQHIEEIVNDVDDTLCRIEPTEILDLENYIDTKIDINDKTYKLNIIYNAKFSEIIKKNNTYNYDVFYKLSSFYINDIKNENICVTNDELGITEKTHKSLFEEFDYKVKKYSLERDFEYYDDDKQDWVNYRY